MQHPRLLFNNTPFAIHDRRAEKVCERKIFCRLNHCFFEVVQVRQVVAECELEKRFSKSGAFDVLAGALDGLRNVYLCREGLHLSAKTSLILSKVPSQFLDTLWRSSRTPKGFDGFEKQ